ncbi:MAG: RNA recognition motif domain-containing protein [Xenococcaceae cyanobacterium]
MSVRLYVGNLPKESIERQALEELFVDAGSGVSTKLIKDRKTGKCRGFAFVTVPTDEMADAFIEKYNGQPFMDTTLKIEKALPRTKGKEEQAEGGEVEANSDANENANSNSNSNSDVNRKKSNKRPRRQTTSTNPAQPTSIQPDPRWAGELAKLKEMLAAQASNS